MIESLLTNPAKPDWEGFVACIKRQGTPGRVYNVEHHAEPEIQDAIVSRFGLLDGLSPDDPALPFRTHIRVQRLLGYDYVLCDVDGLVLPTNKHTTEDTAELRHSRGRAFTDEHRGPITNWRELDAYPWPRLDAIVARSLDWYNRYLPDDMCIAAGGGLAHFLAWTAALMGYETLCYALYDDRDLVRAIVARLTEIFTHSLTLMLQCDRVKVVWGKDDMGFKTSTLISPRDLRELFFPGHRLMARMCHEAGRLYLLHSDGDLSSIIDDLIDDVRIDGRHAFEDTIEDVRDAKQSYGQRVALLGGIDVDFLCRSSEAEIRRRVRDTLETCMQGGGFCLGSGNGITNYCPVDNYLIMLDEGRRFAA
jgi:uroporphyrinogen decarboxylase